jgi:hypothetical protein
MKYLVITYINSDKIIADIESIMSYYRFNIIECNRNYRVFSGNFYGSAGKLANKLNTELEETEFDIEDSLFIVYPLQLPGGIASLSSKVIKRKGNRFLRKHFLS